MANEISNGTETVLHKGKQQNQANKIVAIDNTIKSNIVQKTASKSVVTKAKKNTVTAIEKKTTKKVTTKKTQILTPDLNNGIQTIDVKKPKQKVSKVSDKLKLTFQLRYHTEYGQNLFITGNHEILGNGDADKALPMHYFNEEFWYAVIELDRNSLPDTNITYNYLLKNSDGTVVYDWGNDKVFNPSTFKQEALLIDGWNYAGYFENAFYTVPFQQVLLKNNFTKVDAEQPKTVTHTFRVKTPLLSNGQTLCIVGNCNALGNWDTEKPVLLSRAKDDIHFTANLNLTKESFPIAYKYGVYDVEAKQFIRYEDGNNRILYDAVAKNKHTIVNDAFAVLPVTTWKGAGVAIPVFSLRSENSFGVGEFTDLNLLTDWSKKVGLKLIQILPINDTTATHTWMDSYPYAAISAFALHPMYLNLSKTANSLNQKLLNKLEEERKRLNNLDAVDYEAVTKIKIDFVKKIFVSQKEETFNSSDYKKYFDQNKHWLIPYAVFCYLRDQYGSSHFNEWPAYRTYKAADVEELTAPTSKAYDDIALHYFIQYHLHLQLKAATDYAHQNGIIVKGDIAIGIYRYGADAWQSPELYHMDVQAGAPPDDFAIKGQNWGFPTYNWEKMRENGFAWWKLRFEQMSYYFDAFRIDHILGFFRIWSIPMDAVEGIMGYFVPAIPVHINEFNQRGLSLDYHRYTKPFINDPILNQLFGEDVDRIKSEFLNYDGFGNYTLKPAFATQRLVEKYFLSVEDTEANQKLKQGLFDIISNVILFEVANSNGQQFHFRFGMESTTSFQYFDYRTQEQLKELYVNYFFRRQDDFWMKEALQKLPALKRVTNMLVCGEDLGMVPDCVPDVMKQLGLLSLEIQRMPKDPKRAFFHPNDAPYLSVVTPSTHDMSTIRGWWEEDKERIQKFYNHELGQWGDAPFYCEAWINKAILIQHLSSPAMWSIFQLQDLLGMDEHLRRENPNDERINVPANPKHYWQYRMHFSLERLLNEELFNNTLQNMIVQSGR